MWFVLCAFVIPSVFCALLGLYLCIYQTRMPSVRDESAHLLYTATKRQPPSPPTALMNFCLPPATPPIRRFCPLGQASAGVGHRYPNWQMPSPILPPPPPAYSENPAVVVPSMDFENPQILSQHQQQQQQFVVGHRWPTLCAIAMPKNF